MLLGIGQSHITGTMTNKDFMLVFRLEDNFILKNDQMSFANCLMNFSFPELYFYKYKKSFVVSLLVKYITSKEWSQEKR